MKVGGISDSGAEVNIGRRSVLPENIAQHVRISVIGAFGPQVDAMLVVPPSAEAHLSLSYT